MNRYVLDGQYGKYLEMIGIRVGEALKAAGIPEDLFSRKQPVLDESEYYCFMDAVGRQITDPALPVLIASADSIECFSPPIFAAYCSKNALICLDRLSRYKRIIAPMRYEIIQEDGTTSLLFDASRENLTMPQFLVETEIVFIIHILRIATKQDIIPVRIEMQAPVQDDEFIDFVRCEVRKGNRNIIVFDDEDMNKPFISYNDNMWDFFEPELQRRLSETIRDAPFAAKVRSSLAELLPRGEGTADSVAEKLSLGKRTLQRRLAEENTSFRKQLDETRNLLASHYLRNTNMSTSEIAFMLGYHEMNSFLRAFHNWTGMNVTEYKKLFPHQTK